MSSMDNHENFEKKIFRNYRTFWPCFILPTNWIGHGQEVEHECYIMRSAYFCTSYLVSVLVCCLNCFLILTFFLRNFFFDCFFSGRYELKMSNNKNDYYVTANISLDTSHDLWDHIAWVKSQSVWGDFCKKYYTVYF